MYLGKQALEHIDALVGGEEGVVSQEVLTALTAEHADVGGVDSTIDPAHYYEKLKQTRQEKAEVCIKACCGCGLIKQFLFYPFVSLF